MKNMKMNKWTMGLAAAGIVSLSSVAQAQDAAAGAEALAASTTLSGYVSTGYKFNNGAAGTGYFRADQGPQCVQLGRGGLKTFVRTGRRRTWTPVTPLNCGWAQAASDIGTEDDTVTSPGTVELMQANIDLRWIATST